jgi:preprotein translocase subunit SecF
MDILRDTKIDWLKYRWYFVLISLGVFLLGVGDVYRKGGVRYGIDFSEGTIVYAKFEKTPQIDVIRASFRDSGLGEAVIQRYDAPELNQVMIRVERRAEDAEDLDTTANLIINTIREQITDNTLVDTSTEIVGPVVGQELRRKARNATWLALLAILVYIALRFEFIFGVGATIAVIHDVLLTLALISIFNFEISLNVIAAFLTLVGYSVNDTIVIFDRVRENRRLMRRESLYNIINLSINQTLRRTVLTSFLTLVVVVGLYVLGGEVLRGFAFVLVAGVFIGTYSSIAIATPIVIWWKRLRDKPAPAKNKTKAEAKTVRI